MFPELHKLATEGNCNLLLLVSANGANIKVVVTPMPANKDTPAALSQKLALESTPEEMEVQFHPLLSKYADSRKSLQQSVDDAVAIMDAAKATTVQQTTEAVAKGAEKPAAPAAKAPAPAPQGGTNGDEISLF